MKLPFLPALLVLATAGCTSSEPATYTPAMAPTVPAQAEAAAGFPSPPACEPGTACALTAEGGNCRTVGAVTTCDVPPDPLADTTTYTN
jgi:hypothetical protein